VGGSGAHAAGGVHLARHGRTAYNLERRFQGLLPVGLDDTGRAQAHELAERASRHRFAALWCSPLRRARETADIVAARIGLTPAEDERLVETDSGEWTDRTFAEVQKSSPREFARFADSDPTFAFPGGESFAQQGVRVAAALRDIEAGLLPALAVCHGMVIRVALAQRTGQPLALVERVPNGALVALDQERERRAEESRSTSAAPSRAMRERGTT